MLFIQFSEFYASLVKLFDIKLVEQKDAFNLDTMLKYIFFIEAYCIPGAYSPDVQGVQRTPCDITGTHVNYI